MLTISVDGAEHWDEAEELFRTDDDDILNLEHSLLALSKWESKYLRPFLAQDKKQVDEVLGYIECMVIDPHLDPDVLTRLTQKNVDEIQAYIDSAHSATTFRQTTARGSGEVITTELIYYWMFTANIPIECERWHLNRLFSLIRITAAKNAKPQKMPSHEVAQQYRDLNAQRKRELNTTG